MFLLRRDPGQPSVTTQGVFRQTIEHNQGKIMKTLAEKVKDIEQYRASALGRLDAHKVAYEQCGVLLDAVRELTGERDAAQAVAIKAVDISKRFNLDCAAARVELDRYRQRDIAHTHPADENSTLPAPLSCPNCAKSEPWRHLVDDYMKCYKDFGGCGYGLSLDPADPENLRAARDAARAEVDRLTANLAAEKERGDRLAEGVRLLNAVTIPSERPDGQDNIGARVAADAWARKYGHLAGGVTGP